jgi:hypothetical protein
MDVKRALLDSTLFIVLVTTFTGFVVAMLIYLQFFYERKEVEVQDIMEGTWHRPTIIFPLTLHVSTDFRGDQVEMLEDAAHLWGEATRGRAAITIESWKPDGFFNDEKYQAYPLYTVWLLDGDDLEVAKLLVEHNICMVGVCKGRYIGILKDTLPDEFVGVALHEMGHLMGLEHVKAEYECLMNLKSNGKLTSYDLMQFDYLYGEIEPGAKFLLEPVPPLVYRRSRLGVQRCEDGLRMSMATVTAWRDRHLLVV